MSGANPREIRGLLSEVLARMSDLQFSIDLVDLRTEAIAKAVGVPPLPDPAEEPDEEPRHHGQEDWLDEE